MQNKRMAFGLCVLCALCGELMLAQDETSAQPAGNENAQQQVQPMEKTPVFRVNVVGRTTDAVNYRHRAGSTKIDFRGTDLMPEAKGSAKVDSKAGRLEINADFDHLRAANSFGPEYLTYVLWAITPQGRPVNLGEVLVHDGKSGIHVTSDLQAFGMIVTAEPYFSVVRPGNLVVMENIVRRDTAGWEQPISAKFDALEKGEYTIDIPASQLPASQQPSNVPNPKVPLELLEARNAVAIAKAAGAEQYAPDALAKAQDFLDRGEDYLKRKQSTSAIGTVARGATQAAEDARLLTIRRKEQERIAAEQRAADERAAKAKAEQEAEARRRQEAEQAEAQAQKQRADAESARAHALEEQMRSQAAAQQAEQARAQAEQARLQAEREKEEMRARLLQQLNQVLQTRDTPRGLIVTMADVLFDSGKATLKPAARERLAKLSGILGAYPGLRLQVEGHTDNIGGDQYNMTLSQKRADIVRDYLIAQGVPIDSITAQGFGKADPVATNDTAAGRQQNRRVDLVVSGEAIGVNISGASGTGTPATTPASTPQ